MPGPFATDGPRDRNTQDPYAGGSFRLVQDLMRAHLQVGGVGAILCVVGGQGSCNCSRHISLPAVQASNADQPPQNVRVRDRCNKKDSGWRSDLKQGQDYDVNR